MSIVDGCPDDIVGNGRIAYCDELTFQVVELARRHRRCFGGCRAQPGNEIAQRVFAREIDARGIHAIRAEQLARQRNTRVRCADDTFGASDSLDLLHRVAHKAIERRVRIGDSIDERRIRAVLEEPPHEIREQRVMRTDGRVDAARPVELAVVGTADDMLVERLSHAMQTLKLESAPVGAASRHLVHGGQRVRVVRRELRIDRFRCYEKLFAHAR